MSIGRYTDILRANNGDLRPGTPVTVYDTATSLPATLYRDSLGNIPADNPIYSDTDTAEIQFYIEEGFYSFFVDGELYIDGIVVFPLSDLVGAGDVTGPGSSTADALARFNGTTGKIIKNSGATLSDTGTLKLQSQGSAPSYANGNLYYDSATSTLNFTNENSNLVMPIGQQVRMKVHNFNGFTFTKGSAVFITGGTATPPYLLSIDVAQANDEVAAEVVGVLLDDIDPDSDGFILVEGLLEGVDTSGFFEGQYVYLSATVAGGLTGVAPHQPNFRNVIGFAANIDATHGSIFVFPSHTQIGHGGSNQYLALDTGGLNQQYRSLLGTAGRLTVTHSGTDATFDVDPTLSGSFLQKTANLSDVASPSAARTSLGLGTAAVTNTGTGPTNTILGNDARLTDARTPTAHAATHASLGTDPVTLAQSQITNLVSDLAGKQPLDADLTTIAGLTPANSDFMEYKSGAWANRTIPQVKTDLAYTASDVGADPAGSAAAAQAASLQKTANLSDVANAATSRTNLGLGGAATLNVGTTAGTVAAGDDSRITGAQQRSDLTAKGDVYVATASATTTRLPVGSNNQFLRSQSSAGTGLRWDTITATDVSAVPTTRNVNTTNGITGGGALSADLTFQPTFGTAANTIAQGNDTRIVNAVQGPASATDTAITLYNGTTGKLVRNSNVLIDATGTIIVPTQGSPASNPGSFNSSGNNLFFTYNDPNQTQVSLGQQVFMLVNNNSGANIGSGSAAYITGVSGSKQFVSAARANALTTSKVAGIAAGRIDAGNDGYLLCQGIGTVDTTGMAVNDTLYLSTAVGGALTTTSPVSPDFSVKVGTVASVAVSGKVNIYIDLPENGIGTNGQVELANSTAGLGTQWLNSLSCGINPSGGLAVPAGGIEVTRTAGTATLNQMYLLPVSLLRAGTLSGILIEVTGTTATSVMRAGVYGSNSSNQPTGIPLADFGQIPTATSGVKLWSPISLAMSPGVLYYIALVAQTAAPTVRLFTGFNPYVPSSPFPPGATPGWNVAWTQSGVSGVLPPIGSLSNANGPVTGLLF